MPDLLKRFHSHDSVSSISHNCGGEVTTSTGPSLIAKIIGKLASMPPSMNNSSVSVCIQQLADGSEI